ncbi:hypothetical protein UFOVP55_16 [uncultured Caudovirales phage]|uniref:Tail fiber domain-containing protein n=1 Tax=uncultured Caudovirales phage TaxID=2100421 RepID=A0A6J5KXH7_9CAUD|nr:hypothetical protein UFOVP55_16 [uncultured Caudovirales phage]
MGGKNSAPPPPDYSGVAAASEKSAEYSYKLGQEQLAWAKEQYASDKSVSDRVVNSFLDTQAVNDATAVKDRARYEKTYQPLEDKLAADAGDYANGSRRDLEMGRAEAGVAQSMNANRAASMQRLQDFGVDPTSLKSQALDRNFSIQQGAATAAAGNQASEQVDATGRALRSEAINVGRGYPGQIAGQYGTALQAGSGAVNSALATTASGANTMGTANQWQNTGNSAVGTWGNTLNMGYQNQMAQYNANQNSSSGWGSALGMGVGLLTTPLKGTALGMLAEGGPVPDVSGGQVPAVASPSRGQAVDDVPARLNVGEFVMPKDAASWYGEKHLQGMIEKSRQDREKAVAKPKVAIAAPEAPTFSTRSSALPVG